MADERRETGRGEELTRRKKREPTGKGEYGKRESRNRQVSRDKNDSKLRQISIERGESKSRQASTDRRGSKEKQSGDQKESGIQEKDDKNRRNKKEKERKKAKRKEKRKRSMKECIQGFKKAFRDDGSVIAPHSVVQLAVIFTAELLGTALLLIIGCLGSTYPPGEYKSENYHLQSCLVFGMAVMFIIQILGHTSSAHINPAVTLCALLLGKLRVLTFFVYVVAQVIGGLLGVGVLKAMVPNQSWNSSEPFGCCKTCLTIPSPHLSNGQAFLAEFIITSILIFVVCGIWDRRSGVDLSAPLKFGFTIFGLALAEGHYTGASMNPARSFAPAVWEGEFERHWVYWTAPFLGSLFATLVYSLLFEKDYWKRDRPEEMSLTDIKSSHRHNSDD